MRLPSIASVTRHGLPSLRALGRELCAFATALSPIAPAQASARLVVVRVKGDGRCLYRSIARSLAAEERRELPAKLETDDADALRKLAWHSICVERASEFMRKNIVEGSLRNYCAQMRSPTFFAGEAEILALSDALKTPICVFLDAGRGTLRPMATYGEKYRKRSSGKLIRVLYNGHNHYNAVVLR